MFKSVQILMHKGDSADTFYVPLANMKVACTQIDKQNYKPNFEQNRHS